MVVAEVLIDQLLIGRSDRARRARKAFYEECALRNAILPGETIVLTPLLVKSSDLQSIASDCAELLHLVTSLAERIFQGSLERLLSAYCGTSLLPFARSVRRALRSEMLCRVDAYLSEDGLKVLEINVGPWIGGLNTSRLFSWFKNHSKYDRRPNLGEITCPEPFPAAMRTIARACRAQGVRVLALVEDPSTRSHSKKAVEEALSALRDLGLDAVHSLPSELELNPTSRTLSFGNKRIDGLCRLFPLSMLTGSSRAYHPIVEALRHKTIIDIMLTESLFVGCKGAFAILWDDDAQRFFTGHERDLIKKYIPRTWPLSSDTVRLALQKQRQLIIKPYFGFGGAGAKCGWEYSSKKWQVEIKKALQEDRKYVLQQRVVPNKFPSFFYSPNNRFIRSNSSTGVLGLFFAEGRYVGSYLRAVPTSQGVVNVTNGAAVGAVIEQS
jgi:hypothetical protein